MKFGVTLPLGRIALPFTTLAFGAAWIWTSLPAASRQTFLESVRWFGQEVIAPFNRSQGASSS